MLHGGGLFVAFSQRGQSGAVSPLVSHAVTEHSYRVVTRDKQTDGKREEKRREGDPRLKHPIFNSIHAPIIMINDYFPRDN